MNHPLIGLLAESERPELRILVIDVLQAHPSPENRVILNKILQDPNRSLRTAAEKVSRRLRKLAEVAPNELAAGAPDSILNNIARW